MSILVTTTLDRLTVQHTAFPKFTDLIEAGGGYRPSLITSRGNPEVIVLANAYDQEQQRRRDPRRVCRS